MYPQYQNLDITKYFTSWGFYTLGFIQRHRPDIELIPLRFKNFNEHIEVHNKANYDWLPPVIESALAQGKLVALLPEDEHVAFRRNNQLTTIVNKFADHAVFWLTQCDETAQQKIYHGMHGFRCKMLEMPWCVLNDCLTYYRVRQAVEPNVSTHHNFLCMVNNQAGHKMQLLKGLHDSGLGGYGKMTLREFTSGFEFCDINPHYPYSDVVEGCSPIGACTQRSGIWISKNVENFLHIEQTYNHIPLIINPETTSTPFMSTEKSTWPILLGHLFLVWGSPGTMAWIQKFYDIDIETFADLAYDRVQIDHSKIINEDSRLNLSLKYLLRLNRNLVINAMDKRESLRSKLEATRWTFGQNMYNFFVEQLKKLPKGA